jgi:tetratricopeptide (TPR) repeat protein
MEGSAVLPRNVAAAVRRGPVGAPFVQRYWAFLSYSHQDTRDAEWLHRCLERFRVPKALVGRRAERFLVPAHLRPIFRDRSELAACSDLSEEIQEALECSRHLIVLCSPAAARSRWVDQEIRTFKQLRPDGEVLAVVLAGEPWASRLPGRTAEECFPPALREEFDDSGLPTGRPAEPIAADLRPDHDGRELALRKIVAGMLDLRLDELVRRDEHRQRRRWLVISGTSLAGMVAASALALTAVQARDSARDQRREAESLVGFMIGDLTAKLDSAGSLQALDAVGARVLSYYEGQDEGSLSDEALAQRSKALTLMGDVAQRRGDLGAALRLYREGLHGTAEALKRDPDNPQRLFDHAQNVFWMGELARQTDQLEAAEASFREYKRLADRMVAAEPANPKWRMEAQYAATNLGIVLQERRLFREAAAEFTRALASAGAFARSEPGNPEYRNNQLETLAWLADAQFNQGLVREATRTRQRQVALLAHGLAAEPHNMALLQKEVPARRALGRLLANGGDLRAGLPQLERAVEAAERLVRAEPANMIWLQLAAAAQLELAGVLLAGGSADRASREADAGCAKLAGLEGRDDRLVDRQALQAECLARRARIALARSNEGEALVLAGQALAAAQSQTGADAAGRAFATAAIHRLIGDVHRQAGDHRAALVSWQAALSAWPAAIETPRQKAVRADLLQKVGRRAEAAPLEAELQAQGYRNFI